jgi:hypothetical protein
MDLSRYFAMLNLVMVIAFPNGLSLADIDSSVAGHLDLLE